MSTPSAYPITGIQVNTYRPDNGDHPTNGMGMLWLMDYIDPRKVLAKNLQTLLDFAKEHEDSGPASAIDLERETEKKHPGAAVSDSAIGRYLAQESSAHLDHLSKIAQAYDLHVWQLLYPNLEPANPPVLRRTPTEEELYALLEAGRKLLAQGGVGDGVRDGQIPGSNGGNSPHRPVPSKVATKRTKARP